MIIKEMIQRVQSLYSKGVQSDDSRLSSRHIYSKLLSVRAKLITQAINKRQGISQWNFQTLNCVKLIEVPPYECPCVPPIGCVILRTKEVLPKPLNGLLNGDSIQSVTSLEGSVNFSPTTWEDKKYKRGSKYTSQKPDYFIRENFMYITTKSSPKFITITGLFEDPLEVFKYPNECVKEKDYGCFSILDKELPIDKSMVDTMIELAVQELIGVFSQNKEDVNNNASDSIKENTK